MLPGVLARSLPLITVKQKLLFTGMLSSSENLKISKENTHVGVPLIKRCYASAKLLSVGSSKRVFLGFLHVSPTAIFKNTNSCMALVR